jgi:hypothetical protein
MKALPIKSETTMMYLILVRAMISNLDGITKECRDLFGINVNNKEGA